jgi:hypothetical protein
LILKLSLILYTVFASALQIINSISKEDTSYHFALTAALSAIIFGLNWLSPNFNIPGDIGQFDIMIRMIFACYGSVIIVFLYINDKLPEI